MITKQKEQEIEDALYSLAQITNQMSKQLLRIVTLQKDLEQRIKDLEIIEKSQRLTTM